MLRTGHAPCLVPPMDATSANPIWVWVAVFACAAKAASSLLLMRRTQLRNEDDTGFPKLPAPARRALSGAGYTHLDQLAQVSESELTQLHGMGPRAIAALRAALAERGLSFRS